MYSKMDLFNDINACVERYVEQELAAMLPIDEKATPDIIVESDSEGDNIDKQTGDIWDLDAQEIVGRKDMATGEKTWWKSASTPPREAPSAPPTTPDNTTPETT